MSDKTKTTLIDFGFEPEESEHHFLFYQKAGKNDVYFFEMGEYVKDRDFSTLEYGLNDAHSSFRCLLKAVNGTQSAMYALSSTAG